MKKFTLIASIFIFCSCSNSVYDDAALAVSESWNAQSYDFKKIEDSKNANAKTLVLTIENLMELKPDYPLKKIASMAALTFIKNLSYEDYQDCIDIKIIIDNSSKKFEKTFSIKEILIATDILNTTEKFSKKVINGDFKDFELFFDKVTFPDSVIIKIKRSIVYSDSINGKQIQAYNTGFDFKPFPNTNDTVFLSHFETSNAKSYSDFKLIIRINDKKIIGFSVNN